jgi:hypothetical protein
MKTRTRMLALAAVLISACSPAPEAEPPPAGPEATARQLVADVLGISADQVQVISVEARQFSDSSLDCPQPGMSYLQVITPGHRLLLEAEGRRFDVRSSGGQGRICRKRKPADGPSSQSENSPAVSDLADSARRDLAEKLTIDEAFIQVLGVRTRQAKEKLSGCELNCAADGACGYVVELGFADRRFTYFASQQQLLPCPAISRS